MYVCVYIYIYIHAWQPESPSKADTGDVKAMRLRGTSALSEVGTSYAE